VKNRRNQEERRRLSGSYDKFFSANTRPSRLQSWGLVLLGGNLIVLGAALLLVVVSKLIGPTLDPGQGFVLLLGVGISSLIIYFGFLHIKRALAGRNCGPRI